MGQLSTTREKQLLSCFHSGFVGIGWFIPGVDIKRIAKGFKASSLKEYEDPPPCPPSQPWTMVARPGLDVFQYLQASQQNNKAFGLCVWEAWL